MSFFFVLCWRDNAVTTFSNFWWLSPKSSIYIHNNIISDICKGWYSITSHFYFGSAVVKLIIWLTPSQPFKVSFTLFITFGKNLNINSNLRKSAITFNSPGNLFFFFLLPQINRFVLARIKFCNITTRNYAATQLIQFGPNLRKTAHRILKSHNNPPDPPVCSSTQPPSKLLSAFLWRRSLMCHTRPPSVVDDPSLL